MSIEGAATARLRKMLRERGLRPRKSLAQHFLIDDGVVRDMLAAAELDPGDVVLEVGPGLGVLTADLARSAQHLIAVEADEELVQALQEEFHSCRNLTLVHADILEVEPGALLRQAGVGPAYKVVADLPYYITSAVLRHFLEATEKPSLMITMMQREVARAIVAPPGDMSLLAASVQFYGRPEIVSYVPAAAFYPPPKVESAILRTRVLARPAVEVPSTECFFSLVRAGFSARRKQLRNALAMGLGVRPEEAVALLERAGISPQRRAESLALSEWAQLCLAWSDTQRAKGSC